MMQTSVTQLLPESGGQVPLQGLYLQHQLQLKGQPDKPYVYSNFVTSLDGRIATSSDTASTRTVPASIANLRDWRLYQELAGQADLLITSGRYFRQGLLGEQQDQLPVSNDPAYADIHAWRQAHGLRAQPDIAILSGSLDIPPETLKPYKQRRIFVVTGEASDPAKAETLQAAGANIIRAGQGTQVDGNEMIPRLSALGYRSLYTIAGPAVFHTLLSANCIDRLYLTIAQTLLGGDEIDTLIRGPLLSPARGMSLTSLYHDPGTSNHAGQLLAAFEPRVI